MAARLAAGLDRRRAQARLIAEWGEPILVKGTAYAFADCDIFVVGEMEGLAAVFGKDEPVAELVAINAYTPRRGVGSALLDAIVTHLQGRFHTLRLTTTNDNLDALRFYQRRGFRLEALRPGAVDQARVRKPSIPVTGAYGIPIRDELDLVRHLTP